jgi:hypothetical protein
MDTSYSLPWGQREIESRDLTWVILTASPILKKDRKTPHQRGSGKINYFSD